MQHLNTSLQSNPESSNIILVGDFNLPPIDWSLNQQTPATNGGQLEESFCDLIEDNFLQQYIFGLTHKDGNKLDLLLCNCPEIIKNVSSLPPDQLCFPTHHHIIEFGIHSRFAAPSQLHALSWITDGEILMSSAVTNTQSLWTHFI